MFHKSLPFEAIWPKLYAIGYRKESLPEYTAIFKPGCAGGERALIKVTRNPSSWYRPL